MKTFSKSIRALSLMVVVMFAFFGLKGCGGGATGDKLSLNVPETIKANVKTTFSVPTKYDRYQWGGDISGDTAEVVWTFKNSDIGSTKTVTIDVWDKYGKHNDASATFKVVEGDVIDFAIERDGNETLFHTDSGWSDVQVEVFNTNSGTGNLIRKVMLNGQYLMTITGEKDGETAVNEDISFEVGLSQEEVVKRTFGISNADHLTSIRRIPGEPWKWVETDEHCPFTMVGDDVDVQTIGQSETPDLMTIANTDHKPLIIACSKNSSFNNFTPGFDYGYGMQVKNEDGILSLRITIFNKRDSNGTILSLGADELHWRKDYLQY